MLEPHEHTLFLLKVALRESDLSVENLDKVNEVKIADLAPT